MNPAPAWHLVRARTLGAGPRRYDFNAAVLRPTLRRIVRGDRVGIAETFGRKDIGVDPLGPQKRHGVNSPTPRTLDALLPSSPFQNRPARPVFRKSQPTHPSL